MSCAPFQKHVGLNTCQCRCAQDATVVVGEKGKRYQLNNPGKKMVCRIRLDHCFLSSSKKVCDFLVLDCDKKQAYFVELKGRHVSDAAEQILQSLDRLQEQVQTFTCHARIITSSTPNIRSLSEKKLRKRLNIKNHDPLVQSRQWEETLP